MSEISGVICTRPGEGPACGQRWELSRPGLNEYRLQRSWHRPGRDRAQLPFFFLFRICSPPAGRVSMRNSSVARIRSESFV